MSAIYLWITCGTFTAYFMVSGDYDEIRVFVLFSPINITRNDSLSTEELVTISSELSGMLLKFDIPYNSDRYYFDSKK